MAKEKQEILRLLDQPGVFEHGRLPQTEIIKEYGKASIWAYPTEFTEISCITAMKAQAMGAIPITTNVAALDETVRFGLKIDAHDIYKNEDAQQEFVNGVVNLLKEPPTEKDRKEMIDSTREYFSWDKVAQQWNTIIN
jgi:glycosyltransferase involved in cell wall biosynthesis